MVTWKHTNGVETYRYSNQAAAIKRYIDTGRVYDPNWQFIDDEGTHIFNEDVLFMSKFIEP